jgi:hypothetical protein
MAEARSQRRPILELVPGVAGEPLDHAWPSSAADAAGAVATQAGECPVWPMWQESRVEHRSSVAYPVAVTEFSVPNVNRRLKACAVSNGIR